MADLRPKTDGDIVAFIFQANKYPEGPGELEPDHETLNQIRIVARKP